MHELTRSGHLASPRALVGHGDFVHPAYWLAVVALIAISLLRVPLGQPAMVTAATLLFLGGGLPHGAYDIALLRQAGTLGRRSLALAIGAYVTLAVLMALLWMIWPLLAQLLFLTMAALHFGEDWQMLEEPLLRIAAGAAVIAAATIGHRAQVAALFVAMSDARATLLANVITAAAPMTLLVAAVGIGVAWRDGSRNWAAAMALCLVLLVVLPPVTGFALFFVFLHSPRHLAQARVVLRDMTQSRWLALGGALSGTAIIGWWALQRLAPDHSANLTAQAFQLLASVAVPHLLLTRALERRQGRMT